MSNILIEDGPDGNTTTGRVVLPKEEFEPKLGYATTAQLLDELRARCEVDGTLNYRTVDSD